MAPTAVFETLRALVGREPLPYLGHNPVGGWMVLALLGAYLVMILLESSRFFVEWIPGVSAVQRASLKELLIAVTLILVLRLKP